MDFLDPNKKRNHSIRLMIGYVLVTVAILLATLLLTFISLGFGFNHNTGGITQNGLLFIDAHPQQASMTINGQDKGKTDGRFVLEAGPYSIELKREGYRDWKKDVELQGGEVIRLVYPFLFPASLQTKTILATTSTPNLITASPDRHWIVLHDQARPTTFQVTDTSTKTNLTKEIVVPQAVFGNKAGEQKLELVEWSGDNKALLLKRYFADGFDYLLINRDKPEESINLASIVGPTATDVKLFDKKTESLYVLSKEGDVLKRVNIKSGQTTEVAKGVVDFFPYKDNIVLYITQAGAKDGQAVVRMINGKDDYSFRELAVSSKYLMGIAEFDHDMFVTVGSSVDGKQYVHKNPLTALSDKSGKNSQLLMFKLDNPTSVSFSANTRFIALQSGSKFAVYDAETKRQYRFDVGLKLNEGQKVSWMDGHRMMLVSEGKLNIFEFDGQNKQTLTTMDPSFLPAFDRDYTALFTYGPSTEDKAKQSLSRTELIVKKD